MNSYEQALKFLFEQLPYYQRQGSNVSKFNLSKIKSFTNRLENPHKKIKTIHVAGTNGKGSVSHIIAAILQSKGLRVGIYSSPHLLTFRERIKINGEYISEEYILKFVNKHHDFMSYRSLSFFEMTVGLAFIYFYDQKVDIAIIEVGMGGRLDATNIIIPEISIITNIGLDHTKILGDSYSKIANEKAGIIKKDVPVLIGEYHPETAPIFKRKADEVGSDIYFVKKSIKDYISDLVTLYQQQNLNIAINAIKHLSGFNFSDIEINSAILKVKQLTNFIGRWDIISIDPKIIIDVTHNIEGYRFMLDQLENEKYEKLHLILGFVKEKDVRAIIKLLPRNASYYLCSPSIERAMPLDDLCSLAKESKINFKSYTSVNNALIAAKKNYKADDLIIVSGSTFVVAEII
ncbi:MAG: Mur ligase family protein [Flavobacteriaceae bacterium]|nr:Mur ligase family protein [Flavobacteriaceae bacterium]